MHDQRTFFDSRAEGWEEKCYPPDVRVRLRELVQEFRIRPGARVLDVGTGPGVLNPYLREVTGADGTIVAFDLSGKMIHQARKKTLTPLDLFFQGDAQAMALGTAHFDNVICFAAFPHFPDPEAALRELCRVARPGGEVIIAHLMSREELARHHGSHDAVADDVLPDVQGMRKLFALAGLHEPLIIDRPGRYMARAGKP